MDFSEHCSDWLPDKLEFRTACYKYAQVYGRLLDEFVRENIDDDPTCLQVDRTGMTPIIYNR